MNTLKDSEKRQLKEAYEHSKKILNGEEQIPECDIDGMVPKDTYNQLVNLHNETAKDIKISVPQVKYDISNVDLQNRSISGTDVPSEEYNSLVGQYNKLIQTYAEMTIKMIENLAKNLTIKT